MHNPEVISDTKQIFLNQGYWLCGPYFQCRGVRLHRKVWEYHNGEIPAGFHVHHKDHNRSNNEIGNLALISKAEHMSLHSRTPEAREHQKKQIKYMQELAKAWHKTEEGREFHSKHGKNPKSAKYDK